MLIGLSPIAQPPGIETSALPQRASSGPSIHTLARILRTISYSPTGLSSTVESILISPFGLVSILQPSWLSNCPHTVISDRFGTDKRTDLPPAKMEAAIIGRDEFFEPFTLMSPESRTGPSM